MVEVTIRFGADSDEHAMAGDALWRAMYAHGSIKTGPFGKRGAQYLATTTTRAGALAIAKFIEATCAVEKPLSARLFAGHAAAAEVKYWARRFVDELRGKSSIDGDALNAQIDMAVGELRHRLGIAKGSER